MKEEQQTLLKLADQDWQLGLLADSYKKYCALKQESWHAAFQCAWIESALTSIEHDTVEDLNLPTLTPVAQKLIENLQQRAGIDILFNKLTGNIENWDIHSLRRQAEANNESWWSEQAQLADAAGLYGVAMACWQEAEVLAPDAFYDPPSAMQALPLKIERHLQALKTMDQTIKLPDKK